jgi:hypothetical protein
MEQDKKGARVLISFDYATKIWQKRNFKGCIPKWRFYFVLAVPVVWYTEYHPNGTPSTTRMVHRVPPGWYTKYHPDGTPSTSWLVQCFSKSQP